MNTNINQKLDSLSKSKFRSSFHLNKKMKQYVNDKGMELVKSHTHDFIMNKLAPVNPLNDGKQTPMRQVHPTFIAMHACACCCRGCLEKWHHIKKGKQLTEPEIKYIEEILITWIKKEIK